MQENASGQLKDSLPTINLSIYTYLSIYFLLLGVYELQTMQLHGTPAVWSKALLAYVQACEEASQTQGSMVVGAWRSALGPRQMATVLWQHPTPDGCLSLAEVSATLTEGI